MRGEEIEKSYVAYSLTAKAVVFASLIAACNLTPRQEQTETHNTHTKQTFTYWFQCFAQKIYSKSAESDHRSELRRYLRGNRDTNKGELLPHLFFAFFGHVRMFGDQYLCADGQVHIKYIC